jgi:hypothetical protein
MSPPFPTPHPAPRSDHSPAAHADFGEALIHPHGPLPRIVVLFRTRGDARRPDRCRRRLRPRIARPALPAHAERKPCAVMSAIISRNSTSILRRRSAHGKMRDVKTAPMHPPNQNRTARSGRLHVMHAVLGDVYRYHDEPIALIAEASTAQDNAGRSERRRRTFDAVLRAPLGPRTLSTYHLRGHLPIPL